MAKSIRSKVKRTFRNKKREEGVYAATEAARLHRLSSKLAAVVAADKDGDVKIAEAEVEQDAEGAEVLDGEQGNEELLSADTMEVDGGASSSKSSSKVSTHGHRQSRREEWRVSKGMPARPKSKGMNRQGGVAAKRKSGRPARRR